MDFQQLSNVDKEFVDKIVNKIKSQGIFDEFRKDCLADVDTKPAYQNLQQRVNGTVSGFLSNHKWQHDINKTQLRESLRRHVQQGFLEVGVDRIVEQVVNPKIYTVFTPKVEDMVYDTLGIEKPKRPERTKPILGTSLAPKGTSLAPKGTSLAPKPPPLKPAPIPIVDLLPKDLDPVSPASQIDDSDDSNTIDETKLLMETAKSNTINVVNTNNDNAGNEVSRLENNHTVPSEESHSSKLSGFSDLLSHGSMSDTDVKTRSPRTPTNFTTSKFNNFSNLSEKIKQFSNLGKFTSNKPPSSVDHFTKNASEVEQVPSRDPLNKCVEKDINSFGEESKESSVKETDSFGKIKCEDSRGSLSLDSKNDIKFKTEHSESCNENIGISVLDETSSNNNSSFGKFENHGLPSTNRLDTVDSPSSVKNDVKNKEVIAENIIEDGNREQTNKIDLKTEIKKIEDHSSYKANKLDHNEKGKHKKEHSSSSHRSSGYSHSKRSDSRHSNDKKSDKGKEKSSNIHEKPRHPVDKHRSRDKHIGSDKNKPDPLKPKEKDDHTKKLHDSEKCDNKKSDRDRTDRKDKEYSDKYKQREEDKYKEDKSKKVLSSSTEKKSKMSHSETSRKDDHHRNTEKDRSRKSSTSEKTRHRSSGDKNKEEEHKVNKTKDEDRKKEKIDDKDKKKSKDIIKKEKEDEHRRERKDSLKKDSSDDRAKDKDKQDRKDKEKESRKRKGERCDVIKCKESRRSSDRDNSGAGGGSKSTSQKGSRSVSSSDKSSSKTNQESSNKSGEAAPQDDAEPVEASEIHAANSDLTKIDKKENEPVHQFNCIILNRSQLTPDRVVKNITNEIPCKVEAREELKTKHEIKPDSGSSSEADMFNHHEDCIQQADQNNDFDSDKNEGFLDEESHQNKSETLGSLSSSSSLTDDANRHCDFEDNTNSQVNEDSFTSGPEVPIIVNFDSTESFAEKIDKFKSSEPQNAENITNQTEPETVVREPIYSEESDNHDNPKDSIEKSSVDDYMEIASVETNKMFQTDDFSDFSSDDSESSNFHGFTDEEDCFMGFTESDLETAVKQFQKFQAVMNCYKSDEKREKTSSSGLNENENKNEKSCSLAEDSMCLYNEKLKLKGKNGCYVLINKSSTECTSTQCKHDSNYNKVLNLKRNGTNNNALSNRIESSITVDCNQSTISVPTTFRGEIIGNFIKENNLLHASPEKKRRLTRSSLRTPHSSNTTDLNTNTDDLFQNKRRKGLSIGPGNSQQ